MQRGLRVEGRLVIEGGLRVERVFRVEGGPRVERDMAEGELLAYNSQQSPVYSEKDYCRRREDLGGGRTDSGGRTEGRGWTDDRGRTEGGERTEGGGRI